MNNWPLSKSKRHSPARVSPRSRGKEISCSLKSNSLSKMTKRESSTSVASRRTSERSRTKTIGCAPTPTTMTESLTWSCRTSREISFCWVTKTNSWISRYRRKSCASPPLKKATTKLDPWFSNSMRRRGWSRRTSRITFSLKRCSDSATNPRISSTHRKVRW